MEIEISDDGGEDEEPLYVRLARQEKELAAQEGRRPEGWIWVEGMDVPRYINFEKIEEEETPSE
jgi:hypothetical protein